jgi:hypothetical protein
VYTDERIELKPSSFVGGAQFGRHPSCWAHSVSDTCSAFRCSAGGAGTSGSARSGSGVNDVTPDGHGVHEPHAR